MKALIVRDVWSPMFFPVTDPDEFYVPDKLIEVPDELIERYRKASREFGEVQDKLYDLWRANR